jgi:LDH2 family malate/lactate/ureidoglycolate dehydrogenase
MSVEAVLTKEDKIYVDWKILKKFIKEVFQKLGVPIEDAEIISDVIISSDLRGIDSHGIQRCKMYYDRIKEGIYEVITKIEVIRDGPTTAVLDGNHGMGPVIGHKAMKMAIEKAKKYGLGAVAVRNSSHYGFAGYYSLMAIKEGMIGITTTNARPAVPPTFGVEPMLGTNPLTAGAPTDEIFPFIIDCATSTIQRGNVEIYERMNKTLPKGLIINDKGESETDPSKVLKNMVDGKAALLPLGSNGKNSKGYKGYGYSTLVEVLSSALQSGTYLRDTNGIIEDGQKRLKVGHFFLVINVNNFIGLEDFMENSGNIMRGLRNSKIAPGNKRIYTAGEKEFESEIKRRSKGIPINKSILRDIEVMKKELGINQYKFNF